MYAQTTTRRDTRPRGNGFRWLPIIAAVLGLNVSTGAFADPGAYELKAGDLLTINVWRDEDLTREVLVAPDGKITFPLAGRMQASGVTIEALTADLKARLAEFIDEPVVTIALTEVRGNRIYVLGKVNRPGMFLLDGAIDVMQALSLAGGTTTYADLDAIRILRREQDQQQAYLFQYNHVARGRRLDQNMLLMSGDIVVVN